MATSTLTSAMSLSNGQDNQSVTAKLQKIENEISQFENMMSITMKSISDLNNVFGQQANPPDVYIEEYKERTDQLAEYQRKVEKLKDDKESLERALQEEKNNANAVLASRSKQTLLPTPKSRDKTPSIGSAPHSPKTPQYAKIYVMLPNGKTTIMAAVGKTIGDVIFKSARLKTLQKDLSQSTIFNYETREIVEWDVNSMELANCTLELSSENSDWKQKTRILKASHNFVNKTFLFPSECDNCEERILFQGVQCKMCGFKLHPKCIEKVPDFCITRGQIHELEKIIRPQTPSPASPSTPIESGMDVKGSGDPEQFRRRSNSQPQIKDLLVNPPSQQQSHFPFPDDAAGNSSAISLDPPPIQHHPDPVIEDWEVRDEIIWGEKIGSGSYGIVYRCRWHGISPSKFSTSPIQPRLSCKSSKTKLQF